MSENKKFCPYCGTEIVQGGKFCFNCGAKIPEQTLEQTVPEEKESKLDGAKFSIYGATMSFSKDLDDYNKVRKLFTTYAYKR